MPPDIMPLCFLRKCIEMQAFLVTSLVTDYFTVAEYG